MRTYFIAGNWKMNKTFGEVNILLSELKKMIMDLSAIDIAVCPPYPYLSLAVEILKGSDIAVGAQNMAWEKSGAYTGEVSPDMIKDVGCKYVILGHSERRKYFSESDELINKKIKLAISSDLYPIVCVGESLEQRENNETEHIVKTQIAGCLRGLLLNEIQKVTIAYEPLWAIGTGKTATPEQAQKVHQMIRDWLRNDYDREIAESVRIQYGGSVKPENAELLLSQPDIDGALVGGASLEAESFAAIIKST
ncbi:MAG: triose-phosphate isomerase [bacterium]